MVAASYLVFRLRIVSFFGNYFLILIVSQSRYSTSKRAHGHAIETKA